MIEFLHITANLACAMLWLHVVITWAARCAKRFRRTLCPRGCPRLAAPPLPPLTPREPVMKEPTRPLLVSRPPATVRPRLAAKTARPPPPVLAAKTARPPPAAQPLVTRAARALPRSAPATPSDDMLCVVCMDARRSVVMPCRHMCTCTDCTHMLVASNLPCPVCREPFRLFTEIFVV